MKRADVGGSAEMRGAGMQIEPARTGVHVGAQFNGAATSAMATGESPAASDHSMPCPVCGHQMPDLKGGKGTICSVCGFKDSCCY